MDKAAETVDPLDPVEAAESARDWGCVGDLEVDAPVGSSLVVVLDEDSQDGLEMTSIADQQPVQALVPDGTNPSLRIGVGPRRLDGGSDDAGVLGNEDLVEGGHELGVAVTDQELDLFLVVGQGGGQVAGDSRVEPIALARLFFAVHRFTSGPLPVAACRRDILRPA